MLHKFKQLKFAHRAYISFNQSINANLEVGAKLHQHFNCWILNGAIFQTIHRRARYFQRSRNHILGNLPVLA